MVDDLDIRKDANNRLTTRLSSRKWFSRTVNRIFLREMMLSKRESFMLSVLSFVSVFVFVFTSVSVLKVSLFSVVAGARL